MSVQTLRRYLQPSPVLRWHPWAPRVALGIALVMSFVLGAYFAFGIASRNAAVEAHAIASITRMNQMLGKDKPARALLYQARLIDNAIEAYVKDAGPSRLLAQLSLRTVAPRVDVGVMRDMAEYRLRELGGDAPRWKVTSTYCQEFDFGNGGEDVRSGSTRAAAAYSRLLERPVTPEQLAPAVPGYLCAK